MSVTSVHGGMNRRENAIANDGELQLGAKRPFATLQHFVLTRNSLSNR